MPVNYQLGKVYIITNTVNACIYVGSTAQQRLSTRFAAHSSIARALIAITPMYVAMRTLGIEHFTIHLHHNFPCNSKDELESSEYALIQEYVKSGVHVYNVLTSKCGFKHTDEAKNKISIALQGKVASDESKARMSIAQKGRTFSLESRLKISKTKTGTFAGELSSNFTYGFITYSPADNRWRFRWCPTARLMTSKSFACAKHGYWQAKLLAEDERRKVYPKWRSDEEMTMAEMMNIDVE